MAKADFLGTTTLITGSDEFLAEVNDMPQRNLAVELLRKLLSGEIKNRSRHNVVQARSFADAVLFVRLAHAASGRAGATDNVPGFGDGSVDTNANGYPTDTANANTIPNNSTGADRCRRVFQGLLTGAPPVWNIPDP